ncbi:MAG: triphosphoribosyl-dephospho-CoA synthase [Planctomycetaceae bacterium]
MMTDNKDFPQQSRETDIEVAHRELTRQLTRACVLEVTARKLGNVHPEAEFDDLNVEDFLRSSAVAAPWFAKSGQIGVGRAVWGGVSATHRAVGTNTNLGIALLLAPLAAVPADKKLTAGIPHVLDALTLEDAHEVYAAIRLLNPGGLGEAESGDVVQGPTGTLREMMRLAADRDLIAAQYVDNFSLVLDWGCGEFQEWMRRLGSTNSRPAEDHWEIAVIGLQLRLLSEHGDSLIARKCGAKVSGDASRQARRVLEQGWPDTPQGEAEFDRFDRWLRGDGHRRNPGTTADLIAAILFATLRDHSPTLKALNQVPLPLL